MRLPFAYPRPSSVGALHRSSFMRRLFPCCPHQDKLGGQENEISGNAEVESEGTQAGEDPKGKRTSGFWSTQAE